jgi:hypothetical protein
VRREEGEVEELLPPPCKFASAKFEFITVKFKFGSVKFEF